MDDSCTCGKSRVRSEEEMRRLCNRLSRIEGQVRGLREMLQKDVYCVDIPGLRRQRRPQQLQQGAPQRASAHLRGREPP